MIKINYDEETKSWWYNDGLQEYQLNAPRAENRYWVASWRDIEEPALSGKVTEATHAEALSLFLWWDRVHDAFMVAVQAFVQPQDAPIGFLRDTVGRMVVTPDQLQQVFTRGYLTAAEAVVANFNILTGTKADETHKKAIAASAAAAFKKAFPSVVF